MTNTMFHWIPDYAVGIPLIDDEHKGLFALAEEMHQAMLDGKGKDILESLLDNLVAYTGYHFAHEEQLMERTHYPRTAIHRRQHERLRSQTLVKRRRAAAGEATMTIEVMQFIMAWLKNHTMDSDRRIGVYLKSRAPFGHLAKGAALASAPLRAASWPPAPSPLAPSRETGRCIETPAGWNAAPGRRPDAPAR